MEEQNVQETVENTEPVVEQETVTTPEELVEEVNAPTIEFYSQYNEDKERRRQRLIMKRRKANKVARKARRINRMRNS